MTTITKVFIESKYASNTDNTEYTATNCRACIDKFTATNESGSNITVSVNVVPSGGSVGASNLISKTVSIAASKTYTFPELIGHYLEAGDFISVICSAATSAVIRSSGREFTN